MTIELQILQISMLLTNYSKNSYMVGGCVRDSLTGKSPKDYDFVTDIEYTKLEEIFRNAGWNVSKTGQNFLVMNIEKDGIQYEVASFRKDSKTSDGRRPESVSIGTIEDDAMRRDFTVNALYFKLDTGEIIDPTGKGLDDIETRTLRFVGRAEDRIREDYLRIFRWARFVSNGWVPIKKDVKLFRTMFKEAYKNTCAERVRDEIEKMVGI